jgi:hypothetical protein
MYVPLWLGCLKGRNHLKDLDIDGVILKETERENVECIYLEQDRCHRLALMHVIIILMVPQKAGNFYLSGCYFSKRTELREIIYGCT